MCTFILCILGFGLFVYFMNKCFAHSSYDVSDEYKTKEKGTEIVIETFGEVWKDEEERDTWYKEQHQKMKDVGLYENTADVLLGQLGEGDTVYFVVNPYWHRRERYGYIYYDKTPFCYEKHKIIRVDGCGYWCEDAKGVIRCFGSDRKVTVKYEDRIKKNA